MRKFRSWMALILVLALLICNGSIAEEGQMANDLSGQFVAQSQEAVEEKDILDADLLIGYVAKDGATLNPLLCNEQDLVCLNQLVFESMVTLDDTQKPAPMLADSWTHEDKQWLFTLRKGITFHNGAELTAYDVEATYKAFVACEDTNPYYNRIDLLIDDLAAIDDYTVAVKSNYSGLITLYGLTFPIMQSGTLMDDMPRGTGPYWYVSYEVDHAVRIESNPLWWQQQPTNQSIAFRRYDEVGEAIEGLHTNEVEMLSTRSPSAALSRKLADLTSMDYGTTTYEMLVPNLDEGSSMSDLNVRKAVMYAIDRSVLTSNAYLDMAIQSEVPILPGTWLYESQSAVYYYSPERALQLLYDSGWKDLTGDTMLNKLDGIKVSDLTANIITYNEDTSSIRENAANMIAGYLNAVGIQTTVEVLDRSDVRKRMKSGDYDLALIGVNLSEVPVMQSLLASNGNLNFNGYSSSTMDNLIALTATEQDEAALKQTYSEIQLSVVEELPILGLLFRAGTVLSSRSLGGLTGIRMLHTFRGLEYLSD